MCVFGPMRRPNNGNKNSAGTVAFGSVILSRFYYYRLAYYNVLHGMFCTSQFTCQFTSQFTSQFTGSSIYSSSPSSAGGVGSAVTSLPSNGNLPASASASGSSGAHSVEMAAGSGGVYVLSA